MERTLQQRRQGTVRSVLSQRARGTTQLTRVAHVKRQRSLLACDCAGRDCGAGRRPCGRVVLPHWARSTLCAPAARRIPVAHATQWVTVWLRFCASPTPPTTNNAPACAALDTLLAGRCRSDATQYTLYPRFVHGTEAGAAWQLHSCGAARRGASDGVPCTNCDGKRALIPATTGALASDA